jgi:hypothetical protein
LSEFIPSMVPAIYKVVIVLAMGIAVYGWMLSALLLSHDIEPAQSVNGVVPTPPADWEGWKYEYVHSHHHDSPRYSCQHRGRPEGRV